MFVTSDQLEYEYRLLLQKLQLSSPDLYRQLHRTEYIEPNPLVRTGK